MNVLRRMTARSGSPVRSFYCRMKNRVVGSCGMSRGPEACPLRYECQAYYRGASPTAPSPPPS